MKTKLLLGLILLANVAVAAPKEPITISNVQARVQSLKAGETREYLGNFVKYCVYKDWANCHLAWYDLQDSGLKYVASHEDGFTYAKWMYLKNPEATDIYDFVINGLSHSANSDAWDIGVKLDAPYRDVMSYVPARYALFDPGMRAALIELIQANLGTYDIQYNVSTEMSTPREEWYKLLALSFMSRKDAANTYKVLEALNKYGRIKHSTRGYAELSAAIQSYFQKTGVTK